MEMFEVGGCVRDEILGIPSKDIDFSVVLKPFEMGPCGGGVKGDPFATMRRNLERLGFEIFVENPEFLTIRARFPKGNAKYKGLTADFVLARKEGTYSDGRRPDSVQVGTLKDDLARRDFTMNAIAKDHTGHLIDPFGGQQDIADRVIRAVGDAHQRIIVEDALRGMRALRFAVQKDFVIDEDVFRVLRSRNFKEALATIATERVQTELEKMFKVDTLHSLFLIETFGLAGTLFDNTGLRLMPTMKG